MLAMLRGARPGMTEHEAFALYRPIGLPHSYHPVLLSGERTALGLASPSGRELRLGDPMSAGFGYWGSNIARGGFLAGSAADLPDGAADYVARLVAPYFACAAEWYETIGIGVTGAQLFEVARRHLGDPFFGVHLNPGHFIHLDEWPSSPVFADSDVALASGMTLQRHHPGHRHHLPHHQHRGRCRARRRRDAGAAGGPVPGPVAAGHRAAYVHGRHPGDHAQARGAAAVEPGGVPAAVLAVAAPGHAAEVSRQPTVTSPELRGGTICGPMPWTGYCRSRGAVAS
jgi:hypothetical protein